MIWIIGDKGMLGQELGRVFDEHDIDWVGTDREVDFTRKEEIEDFYNREFSAKDHNLDWIVNCAAYTAVDKAEDEPEFCALLNVDGPRNLATLASACGSKILHISTDYVFNGRGFSISDGNLRPYTEDDPIDPQGVYGRTKADGENIIRTSCDKHVIVRTSWLYGSQGENFVYTMIRIMKKHSSIDVVDDQYGSPTWTINLAEAIKAIVSYPEPVYGIYHFSGVGRTTWCGFAQEIYRIGRNSGIIDQDCKINPVNTDQYPTKAKRPVWSVMSKDKIIKTYRVSVPEWKTSLGRWFEKATKYFDEMKALKDHADYDIDTARAMLKSARYLYVLYCMQQAIEKYSKVIIALSERPPFVHNLLQLTAQAGIEITEQERNLLIELSQFYIKGRYKETISKLSNLVTKNRAERIFFEGESLCQKILTKPIFSIL
jgi:dTDP-4-dehydrorhamnose reductase